MSAPPRVTVLLPVWNALPTLPRALASLREQTFVDWEIIAVDDGATDGSRECLLAEARREPRLRVLVREHHGLVSALNEGLAAARGEYIARMDADDECLPRRLAEQVAWLDRDLGLGVVGSLVAFGGHPLAAAGYAAHIEWLNALVTQEDIAREQFVEAPLAHPSVMFRRSLVARRGGYREGDFPEDYELWLRWLEAGVRFAKVPQVLLRWNDPPGRLTRNDRRYDPEAFFRCKAPFLARWLRANVAPSRRLLVWGAGRPTRRRAGLLRAEGVRFDGYVDIDPRKFGRTLDGLRVSSPEEIPMGQDVFVLGYVAARGARACTRDHLLRRGFSEGRDFLFAA